MVAATATFNPAAAGIPSRYVENDLAGVVGAFRDLYNKFGTTGHGAILGLVAGTLLMKSPVSGLVLGAIVGRAIKHRTGVANSFRHWLQARQENKAQFAWEKSYYHGMASGQTPGQPPPVFQQGAPNAGAPQAQAPRPAGPVHPTANTAGFNWADARDLTPQVASQLAASCQPMAFAQFFQAVVDPNRTNLTAIQFRKDPITNSGVLRLDGAPPVKFKSIDGAQVEQYYDAQQQRMIVHVAPPPNHPVGQPFEIAIQDSSGTPSVFFATLV